MRFVNVAAIAVVAVGLVGGCVSKQQYDKLARQNDALQQRFAAIDAELQSTKNQLQQAQSQLGTLQDKLQQAQQLTDTWKAQAEKTKDAYDKLLAEYDKLKAGRAVALPVALSNALEQFAAKHPGMVTFDKRRGLVKFASDLTFDLGSDVVKPEAADSLRALCEILNQPAAAGFDILVVGHTDNVRIAKPETRAKHPTNWHLSVHRAIAVKDVLVNNKIDPKRIGVMGFGQFRPIAPNDPKKGNPLNRRVEIFIVPAHQIITPGG